MPLPQAKKQFPEKKWNPMAAAPREYSADEQAAILDVYDQLGKTLKGARRGDNGEESSRDDFVNKLASHGRSREIVLSAIGLGEVRKILTLREYNSSAGDKMISVTDAFWELRSSRVVFKCFLFHAPVDYFLALSLSGGGTRASLFHMGIMLYLALVDELKHIKVIVSASGGSITSGHFVQNWQEAISGRDGFISVSSRLVRFLRTNIRDTVFIPWIWSRLQLLRLLSFRLGLSARLEKAYRAHFENTKFGDISSDGTEVPLIAILSTDGVNNQRYILTSDRIIICNLNDEVSSTHSGARLLLSKAVAMSSCFPLIFSPFKTTYKDLGITFDEFKLTAYLNDGGVADNLGINALCVLKSLGYSVDRTLVSSSDVSLSRGAVFVKSDIDMQSAQLAEDAMHRMETLGPHSRLARLYSRVSNDYSLPHDVQTQLFSYRTDLDSPTWPEVYALLLHGVSVAFEVFRSREIPSHPSPDDVKSAIKRIIEFASGEKDVEFPTEDNLAKCGNRPISRAVRHIVAVAVIYLVMASTLLFSLSEIAGYCFPEYWPSITPRVLEFITPLPINDIDILSVANNAKKNLPIGLSKKSKWKITFTLDKASQDKRISKRIDLDASVSIEINCEGNFDSDQFKAGEQVEVVGKLKHAQFNSPLLFIDLYDCTAKIPK